MQKSQENSRNIAGGVADLTTNPAKESTVRYPKTLKKQEPIYLRSNAHAASIFNQIWDKATFNVQERVYVIFLDSHTRKVIDYGLYATGTHNQVDLHVGPLFRDAILKGANSFIIAHNHPSNFTDPSELDILATQKILLKARLLDMEVIDHMIVNSSGQYTSLLNSKHSKECLKRSKRFEGIMDDKSYESIVLEIADRACQGMLRNGDTDYHLQNLRTNMLKVFTKFFDPIVT